MEIAIIRSKPALFDSLVTSLTEGLGPPPEENQPTEPGLWPDVYVNADTGKAYKPHHEAEKEFVETDAPRYGLIKGGEGGGKSCAAIIKDLERIRRGMSGILVSPDLPHFRKSLWPEFRRWCPPMAVVGRERYRLHETWEPNQSFALHFNSEVGTIVTLHCGGIEDPSGWEGPNVNFAHFDEARRHDQPLALKVLDGRVRIPGPRGEPPQLYISTTPKKHWLFDYFGPPDKDPDPLGSFKADSRVVTLLTKDNEAAGNLAVGFTHNRGKTLSAAERRVLLEAEWEDVDDTGRFLTSIIWWDSCQSKEIVSPTAPLVVAVDAGVSSDTFGVIGVARHPSKRQALAVAYARVWVPIEGKAALDFDEIELELRQLCRTRNVLIMAYDPYQLHQMMTRLHNERVVTTKEFNQGVQRSIADKALHDMIIERRIAHDGNAELRQHIDNADKKIASNGSMRLVKRSDGLKIDLTVALSMAAQVAMEEFFGGSSTRGLGFIHGSVNRKLSAL